MKRSDFAIDFSREWKLDPDWLDNRILYVEECISIMPWPEGPEEGSSLKQAIGIAPEGVRRFYLIGQIQGPADNGGLGQYFGLELPDWLHDMAKKAIADIGCPQMISIIEEAERYVAQHRDELRAAGSWEDFHKILGIGAMNDVLDNIAGRYLNASKELDAAKRRYMERHQDRFY